MRSIGFFLLVLSIGRSCHAFFVRASVKQPFCRWCKSRIRPLAAASVDAAAVDLTGDGGLLVWGGEHSAFNVDKEPPAEGTTVHISYTGTIVASDWTVAEVVRCWLPEQQGLPDLLGEAFMANDIDEAKLTDPDFFTEDFVARTFADLLTNKIQVKKLCMAAKRLASSRNECAVGTVFDAKESYAVTWGESKLILGMSRAIALLVDQNKKLTVQCRSDYAYGAEGYRKRNGEVVVPPFATLQFEIELLPCDEK